MAQPALDLIAHHSTTDGLGYDETRLYWLIASVSGSRSAV
jgi:hypothetical protein